MENQNKNWYDNSYKFLLVLPALMIIFSVGYIIYFHNQHGDFINKDVSLTGGTTITVFDSKANAKTISDDLRGEFPDIAYRVISDFSSGQQKGFSVESVGSAQNITSALERELGYKLTSENSSVEFSGATLSEGFYQQLINAIIAAFLLMSWVVFLIFSHSWKFRGFSTMLTFFGVSIVLGEVGWLRIVSIMLIIAGGLVTTFSKESGKFEKVLALIGVIAFSVLIYVLPSKVFVLIAGIGLIGMYVYNSIPSFAIIFSAFADILMTLVVVNLSGVPISSAGIIAFLMLIGYSVDTDILLTTRLLKGKEGSVNHRIYGAFKTGITMTLTAMVSVGVSFILVYSFSDTLRQIFGIILIGLFFDIFNTWIANASILKWFMEAKKLQ